MRRMITKNGVIDAVNAGIESGEIEVGGGLPEFSDADTGRVLTVVEDAETGDPKASWEDAAGGGGCMYWFAPTGNTHAAPLYLPNDNITSLSDLAAFLYNEGYDSGSKAYPFYMQNSNSSAQPAPISLICGWNELYVYYGLFSSNGTTVSTRYYKITNTAFDSTTGVYTTTKSESPTYGLPYATIKKQLQAEL